MPTYRLQVLGTAALTVHDGRGTELLVGPGKQLALITYLALSPQRRATRDHLIDLLWADSKPDGARRNLRQAMYQTRQRLGDDFLVGTRDDVELTASLSTDRDEFLDAINRGDAERAVALYGGPFFPAFAAPGGGEFERWADLERSRLHDAFRRALEALGRDAVSRHHLKDAVRLGLRLRDDAPDRENGWRVLLEALVAAGEWVQAAAEADAAERHFSDHGIRPGPATLQLLESAKRTPSPREAAAQRLVAELVGRDGEFAAVMAAWSDARLGRPRHLHVVGTAGLGKTRLLRDVAARIASRGECVLELQAHQGERDLPYALAGDLTRRLAALRGAVAVAPSTAAVLLDLDPSLQTHFPSVTPAPIREDELLRLRTLAIIELLTAVADEQPVALLVDDVHWADAASRQVLASLTGRAPDAAVLLVTTTRPIPGEQPPGTPDRTLTLRPLTLEQTEQLIGSLGSLPGALRHAGLVRALHDATEGSPLLLLETLQLALDESWLALNKEEEWFTGDGTALRRELGKGSAVDRRLAALEPSARRTLLSLAMAGFPLAEPLLERIARKTGEQGLAELQRLEQSGFVVRRSDGHWEPAHEVFVERLLADATRDELAAGHRALATALLASTTHREDRLRVAAQHAAAVADRAIVQELLVRFVRQRRRRGDRQPVPALARDLFGDTLDPAVRQATIRAVPVSLRLTRNVRVAAGLLLLAVSAVAILRWLSAPVALAIEQQPLFATGLTNERPFIVSVLDRLGRVTARAPDSVGISITPGGSVFYGMVGPTRYAVSHGRARIPAPHVFRREVGDIRDEPPRVTFRVSARDLPPVDSDSVIAATFASVLFLDSGLVNGQSIDAGHRSVTVTTGSRIRGHVLVSYTNAYSKAAVLAVLVPSWGDRRRSFGEPQALAASVARDTVTLDVDAPGPTAPGRYWMAIVAAAETEARYIASATNWEVGEPRWFDGNDLADLRPAEIDTLNESGGIWHPWLYRNYAAPYMPYWVAGTVIDVVAVPNDERSAGQ